MITIWLRTKRAIVSQPVRHMAKISVPTLGRMIMMNPSLQYQLVFPTVVLCIITVSFYIIGNAFADAADPKNHVF